MDIFPERLYRNPQVCSRLEALGRRSHSQLKGRYVTLTKDDGNVVTETVNAKLTTKTIKLYVSLDGMELFNRKGQKKECLFVANIKPFLLTEPEQINDLRRSSRTFRQTRKIIYQNVVLMASCETFGAYAFCNS